MTAHSMVYRKGVTTGTVKRQVGNLPTIPEAQSISEISFMQEESMFVDGQSG